MTEKKNARPTAPTAGQAVETGTPAEMTTASTKDCTTIGGSGQIGLIADRDFGLGRGKKKRYTKKVNKWWRRRKKL